MWAQRPGLTVQPGKFYSTVVHTTKARRNLSEYFFYYEGKELGMSTVCSLREFPQEQTEKAAVKQVYM